jgi:hypothetical protein
MQPPEQKSVSKAIRGTGNLLVPRYEGGLQMMTNPSILLKNLIPIKPRITVKRTATTYLIQQGWKLTNVSQRQWEGYYRTRFGSYKGKIEHSSPPKFYIHNPPEPLRHHHWACFTELPGGWYSVHFRKLPKDADSGVMEIERLINEAFLLSKKTA